MAAVNIPFSRQPKARLALLISSFKMGFREAALEVLGKPAGAAEPVAVVLFIYTQALL